MPAGYVSFERKLLPLERPSLSTSYPNADFWSTSLIPLCRFEVKNNNNENEKINFTFRSVRLLLSLLKRFFHTFLQVYSSGLIEDQSSAALEVDFANQYIGGGALHSGCVQVCFKEFLKGCMHF